MSKSSAGMSTDSSDEEVSLTQPAFRRAKRVAKIIRKEKSTESEDEDDQEGDEDDQEGQEVSAEEGAEEDEQSEGGEEEESESEQEEYQEEEEADFRTKKPRRNWVEVARYLFREYADEAAVSCIVNDKARELLQRFLPKKFSAKQKSTDIGGWKFRGETHQRNCCTVTRRYTCPLAHRCKCAVQMRIIESATCTVIELCGEHNETSHQNDRSKYLTAEMRGAIVTQVKANPLKTAAQVRKEIQNFSPSKRVPPSLKRSVTRLVRQERVAANVRILGFQLLPTYGSMHNFCTERFLQPLLQR